VLRKPGHVSFGKKVMMGCALPPGLEQASASRYEGVRKKAQKEAGTEWIQRLMNWI
jgi:hypothetical protein